MKKTSRKNNRPAKKTKPTQADVAIRAGVSQAMVSYVLNNNSELSIPMETRQRILNTIEELGYVPDSIARSLRTRKTLTIACVIPDITNPFHPVFAQGVQEVAEQYNYDLLLYNTNRMVEKEWKSIQILRQGRVDGVIITPLHLKAEDLLPVLENIPVVVQGPLEMPLQVGDFPLDSLRVNDRAAAHAAVSFLIERGHTRIGLIAGQKGTPPRQEREAGYLQALSGHQIAVDESLIQDSDFKEAGGYQSMQALLRLSPPPTAVFAISDLMAVGALIAVKEAGLKIPEDIALVGFDDIPIAKLVNPALTTIAQFQAKLGRRAAEMLFERLTGSAPKIGRREEMPYELIVRDSA